MELNDNQNYQTHFAYYIKNEILKGPRVPLNWKAIETKEWRKET